MPGIETHELMRAVIGAINDKRTGACLGISRYSAHRQARPAGPGQTGERNILDRLAALVETLGTREEGRAVLVLIGCWFEERMNAALGNVEAKALTTEVLVRQHGRLAQEFGEMGQALADVLEHPSPDPERVRTFAREAADVAEWLDRTLRLTVAMDVTEPEMEAA